MPSPVSSQHPSSDLALALPSQVITRGRAIVDPRSDRWEWTEGPYRASINFDLLSARGLKNALKRSLVPFLIGSSAHHAMNMAKAFFHLEAITGNGMRDGVTVQVLADYQAKLGAHEKWRLGTLNVLLQKWLDLSLPGVDRACARYLKEHRKPGNTKGRAVLTLDPVDGPFNEEEYYAFYSNVNTAYGEGKLPLWSLLLFRLLLASGGRVSQYAALKIKDFSFATLVLQLPQAKKGFEHPRKSFLEFDIVPQTGHLLQEYIDALKVQGHDEESPLFPASVVGASQAADALRASNDLFKGHCEPADLSREFVRNLQPIAPPTSRLDFGSTPVNTKRFRYTYGTRLRQEGASQTVIANRLGHVDLQQVWIYAAISNTLVKAVDAAIGPLLAPLARAFKGRLVSDESETTQKGALGSRIIDFRVATKPVGSCGVSCSGCSFDKPVACYTCFRFEPWLDAPHHLILERLEAERKEWAHDERMAAINDEAILAVKEVMALCEQIFAAEAASTQGAA